MIFDFATTYARQHATISTANSFEITDSLYNSFMDYIKGKDYTYTTKSERALEQLKSEALKENYFDAMTEEYGHLKSRMDKDKQEDMKKYSDQIRELLKMEIVTRYYYQKGKIEAGLKHDPDLADAIATIKNTDKYSAILAGKYIQPKPDIPVKGEDDDENQVE